MKIITLLLKMKRSWLDIAMNNIKKDLKTYLSKKGLNVDFRRDKYIENNYNLSPVMKYSRAVRILRLSQDFLKLKSFINFNTQMEIDKLRSSTLKDVLENYINIVKQRLSNEN